jgi:hypothetical protein
MIDLAPPPKLWLPPRPAIIRSRPEIAPLPYAAMFQPGFATYASRPKILTFRASGTSGSALTTYTFDNGGSHYSIGTAAADRRIIVGTYGRSNTRTVSSITVKPVGYSNVTLTSVISQAGGNSTTALYIGLVPDGTQADFEIVWSGGQTTCGFGAWSATGLASNTAVDSGGSTANPGSVTLSTLAGGFWIGMIGHNSTGTISWNIGTEDFEDAQGSGHTQSGAHGDTTGASVNPQATIASSVGANRAMVAASW